MTIRVPIRTEYGHTGDRAVDLSAENVEADPTGLDHTDATDVQGVIADFDAAISDAATGGGGQPLDSDLTAIAALTTTPFGRALLTLADAAALRTTGALVIGTDVEAHDADLTTIAGLSPTNDDILQRKAGAWTNRTVAQYLSDLGLGALYQPLDSDLTAIAALTTTATGRSLLAAADAAALRTILALGGSATLAVGTATGTVAAGDDSRFTNSRAPNGSAGGVLDGTYPSPGLAAGVAGDGLSETSDVLSVNVDGSTIETSADALRLKDGGTTNAKLANMAQSTIKGRAAAAGTGVPVNLTATEVRTIVDTNTTPSTQAMGDAAAVGTADTLARGDHKHAMPAFATNGVVLGSSAAAGAATTPMRSNDTIAAFDATAPTTSAIADVAAVGVAAFAARRDHVHGREDLAQSNTVPTTDETLLANFCAVIVEEYVMDASHELIFTDPSEMAVI